MATRRPGVWIGSIVLTVFGVLMACVIMAREASGSQSSAQRAGAEPASIQANGFITGQVTAGDTGQSFSSVAVKVYSTSGYVQITAYPNYFTGIFSASVAPGAYRVAYEPYSGPYAPEWYNNRRSLAAADPVTVTDSAVISNVSAVLDVGGKITGRVTAAVGGAPVANVSVYAYSSPTTTVYSAVSATGSNGVYTITSLLTGAYYLKFDPPYGSDLLVEYYNNKSSQASADPVAVNMGGVTGNIDATLDLGGKIGGQVTDAADATPVQNVYVTVYTSSSSISSVASDYTDSTGFFTVTQLRAGSYYVKFDPPYSSDYLEEYFNGKRSLATADPIAVTLGGVAGNINASLDIGGKITGRVTATTGGAPLQSVMVYAYTSTVAQTWEYVAYDMTDATGVYTVTGLMSGTYYVGFDEYGYLDEYYNNRSALAQADAVPVALGGVSGGIDAALDVGGKITGRVTAQAGGAPIQSISVRAYTSTDSVSSVASASTDASGVYTISNLAAGMVYLEFDPPYASDYLGEFYNDKPALGAANAIPVSLNSVVTNVNAALVSGAKITGRVTGSNGGLPLQDVYVYIYGYDECNQLSIASYATTNASGVYTATSLRSGSYRVLFDPYGVSAAYFSEYYNNKTGLGTADWVTVTVGTVKTGVDAVLQLSGQITGRITAANNGAPLSSVYVVAYNASGGYAESDYTDATGIYTITGLVTGNYRLRFSPGNSTGPDAYQQEYYNDKLTLATANPVSVTLAHITGPVNAVLVRGGRITGRLTAGDGGAPLQYVSVSVYDGSGQAVGSASTNAAGVYTTTGLPTGSYRLYFNTESADDFADDYFGEYYNNQATLPAATPVNVTAPNRVSNIDAVLARGGKITGTVFAGDTGGPLSGVRVSAIDSISVEVRIDYSDSYGRYELPRLVAGNYRVRFYELTLYASTGCSTIPVKRYRGEYYNDKPTLATADPVPVTPPNTVININAILGASNLQAVKVYVPVVRK